MKTVSNMIPNLGAMNRRMDLKDLILTDGRLQTHKNINGDISNRMSSRAYERSREWQRVVQAIQKVSASGKSTSTEQPSHNRRKRLAPVIIALRVVGVTALAGLLSYDTYAVTQLNSELRMMAENQKMIYDGLSAARGEINSLQINQKQLMATYHELTEKLDVLLQGFNCDLTKHEMAIDLATSWANVIPNSFLRALNGALQGDVNVDLLPGKALSDVVNCYAEFAGTIYIDNPELLYKTGKSLLVYVNRDPPTLEVILTFPRIYKQVFGALFHQISCSWRSPKICPDLFVTTHHRSEVIIPINGTYTWSTHGCKKQENNLLCNKRELTLNKDNCIRGNLSEPLHRCPLTTTPLNPDFILTDIGALVCPHIKSVDIQKISSHGVWDGKSVSLNGSKLFTQEDGDAIFIRGQQVILKSFHTPIDLTTDILLPTVTDKNTSFILDFPNATLIPMHPLPALPPLIPIHSVHYVSFFMIIVLIGAVIAILYLIARRNIKHKKRFGFLYNLYQSERGRGRPITGVEEEKNLKEEEAVV